MARTHVAVSVMVPADDGGPRVQGYCPGWPTATDAQVAASILVECKVVNVPQGLADEVVALWPTAKIRSQEMDAAVAGYIEPRYDSDMQCEVCGRGGFCQDAAKELAHDIACILKMTGELAEPFEQAQQNVARWMATNGIRGGDSSALCDCYMEGMKVAA